MLFGEPDDGHICHANTCELLHGRAELPFASVDDDEIWNGDWCFALCAKLFQPLVGGTIGWALVEDFAFFEDARVAATNDFNHRGKIVLSFD